MAWRERKPTCRFGGDSNTANEGRDHDAVCVYRLEWNSRLSRIGIPPAPMLPNDGWPIGRMGRYQVPVPPPAPSARVSRLWSHRTKHKRRTGGTTMLQIGRAHV